MLPARALCLVVLLALAACSTRSISDSGYHGGHGGGNAFYQGELTDLDVLGLPTADVVPDAKIADALAQARKSGPQRGAPLLLVQSGAMVPDEGMIAALETAFPVAPFSGVPPQDHTAYAGQLRLLAAEGGYGQILVYWGALETARDGGPTKIVSWVPVVGDLIPDESQHMRLRLKAVWIDVKTGAWKMVLPDPIGDDQISAGINRASADQGQVARLKAQGYATLAHEVLRAAG